MRKAEGTGGVAPLDHQAIFFALVVRLVSREKLVMMGEAMVVGGPVNEKINVLQPGIICFGGY